MKKKQMRINDYINLGVKAELRTATNNVVKEIERRKKKENLAMIGMVLCVVVLSIFICSFGIFFINLLLKQP